MAEPDFPFSLDRRRIGNLQVDPQQRPSRMGEEADSRMVSYCAKIHGTSASLIGRRTSREVRPPERRVRIARSLAGLFECSENPGILSVENKSGCSLLPSYPMMIFSVQI
jgi:hypothetical protein